MSKTYRKHEGGAGRQRRISARAVRRNPPDLRLLSKALLTQAADEAAALAAEKNTSSTPPDTASDPDDSATGPGGAR